MLLFGVGNLLPGSERHFGISFEAGLVFQGSANAMLHLNGTACLNGQQTPAACLNAATDPGMLSNVSAEQTKLNNDLKPFQFYPVISVTFNYKL